MKAEGAFYLCIFLLLSKETTVYANEGWFLHVTDFHWDYTYGTQDWSCNDNVNNHGLYGDYWCDSPWTLIKSAVEAMKNATKEGQADFILWTGDNVLHVGNDKVNLDIHDQILGNLTDLLQNSFPTVPVYATYGNHDYYPHNQFPPHNNELYNRTLAQWKSWINDVQQEDNFRKGAYYTVKASSGIRILALNTNLYYTSDKITAGIPDPADQFAWMEEVLNTSRANNEKVLVTGHVPPGMAPPLGTRWMYEEFHKKFNNILLKYSDVITGLHFGHEHNDNLRVFYDEKDKPVLSLFMAPSVTPWRFKIPGVTGKAHNPGFRMIKYDQSTGRYLDLIQYYMDLPESNRLQNPVWKTEYTATTDMSIPDITPGSIDRFIKRMADPDGEEFKKFYRWRFLSADHSSIGECDRSCHAIMHCNFVHSSKSKYDFCVAGLTSGGNSVLQVVSFLNILYIILYLVP
ncbi:acid sphingomyelinase-like phosphodiesterase 3b [Saccostrea echinata]|uniref:acid sphingomyelinase-like phosphodiesterase 3b n=1 Tax=Saccostrea echinata TaxID=191078 RepID=UPI002A82EB8D|nr:acid sphingomyelinase-like phosphodiesterase 3b [Saccostrea echinata]